MKAMVPKIMSNQLTEAEKKVVALMRALAPFEVIEIRRNAQQTNELEIVLKSTIKEVFPFDTPE